MFVDLPDLLINLNRGGDRRMRFLKLATAVEVVGEEQAEIGAPVRAAHPRQLPHVPARGAARRSSRAPKGVYRIKEELLARTNEAVKPAAGAQTC